jgi:hypothetical protein
VFEEFVGTMKIAQKAKATRKFIGGRSVTPNLKAQEVAHITLCNPSLELE